MKAQTDSLHFTDTVVGHFSLSTQPSTTAQARHNTAETQQVQLLNKVARQCSEVQQLQFIDKVIEILVLTQTLTRKSMSLLNRIETVPQAYVVQQSVAIPQTQVMTEL